MEKNMTGDYFQLQFPQQQHQQQYPQQQLLQLPQEEQQQYPQQQQQHQPPPQYNEVYTNQTVYQPLQSITQQPSQQVNINSDFKTGSKTVIF